VDPYQLTLQDGGFYLIGHCHLRQAGRIFAGERIRELRPLATQFDPPRNFNAEEYLRDAWRIVKGDVVTVKGVFSRSAARDVRGRLWHPSQKLRELPDGRLELTLGVADTLEVRRWILGFGREAEVLEPAALREALQKEAEALARRLAPSRMPLARSGPRVAGQRRANSSQHASEP
jgi:predicted DNA-binding transcriptional regulator YafY